MLRDSLQDRHLGKASKVRLGVPSKTSFFAYRGWSKSRMVNLRKESCYFHLKKQKWRVKEFDPQKKH